MFIIGHRGGVKERAQENTVEAFKLASETPAGAIECDLHLTKDNVICIYHDYFIDTKTGKQNIKDLSFKELVYYKPDISTFEAIKELLDKKTFIFELKYESNYKEIINNLFELHYDIIKKHRFISFSSDALSYIKKRDSKIYCSYIGTSSGDAGRFHPIITKKHIITCVENGFDELSGHWLTFSPRKIIQSHHQGINVGIGPVNNKAVFNYCNHNKVDVIYTDYVSRVLNYQSA